MIKIRKATKKDTQGLINLFEEFYSQFNMKYLLTGTVKKLLTVDDPHKFASDTIKHSLTSEQIIYVAEENSTLLGYISGQIHTNKHLLYSPEGEIIDWFVTEKFRNQGIGNKLYDQFYKYLKSQKCKSLTLEAFYDNTKTIKTYQKMGFVKDSLILKKII